MLLPGTPPILVSELFGILSRGRLCTGSVAHLLSRKVWISACGVRILTYWNSQDATEPPLQQDGGRPIP